jgi:hypothetical protein
VRIQTEARIARAAGWTAAVVLLTPVILAAGVIAVVAIPALALSRHASVVRLPVRRRSDSVAPVLHLEPNSVEPSLATVLRRAA